MHARSSGPDGQCERHAGQEVVERLTDCAGTHRAPAAERERGRLGQQGAAPRSGAVQILAEQRRHLRPEGHEAALAELGGAHEEHRALEVDLVALQARDLADPEPQPIEQSEDGAVGEPPEWRPGRVGQAAGDRQEPAGQRGIEQVRHALGGGRRGVARSGDAVRIPWPTSQSKSPRTTPSR